MSEKKMPRKAVHELLASIRDYYERTDPCDEVECRAALARMNRAAEACFRSKWRSHNMIDLVSGVYKLKNDATNEDLEAVLALLGWEVTYDE